MAASVSLDQFGLRNIISKNFHEGLSSELERLFVSIPASEPGRHRLGSDGSSASSPGSWDWDDFRSNGKDQDLDDLDKLLRGLELQESSAAGSPYGSPPPTPGLPGLSPEGSPTAALAVSTLTGGCHHSRLLTATTAAAAATTNNTTATTNMIPGAGGGPVAALAHSLAGGGLTAAPGTSSLTSAAVSGCHQTGFSLAGDSAGVLTKAHLLEILRERERERLARRRQRIKGDKICVFCRNNGESEAVYTTHQLKDAQGRITCPVLYIYTCPICGASGEAAHTIKYCPLNPTDQKKKNPCKTPRNSAGRRR